MKYAVETRVHERISHGINIYICDICNHFRTHSNAHTNLRYEVRTDTDTNDNTARINIMPVKTKHRTRKSGTIVCSW